jgi:hypothetical protein
MPAAFSSVKASKAIRPLLNDKAGNFAGVGEHGLMSTRPALHLRDESAVVGPRLAYGSCSRSRHLPPSAAGLAVAQDDFLFATIFTVESATMIAEALRRFQ